MNITKDGEFDTVFMEISFWVKVWWLWGLEFRLGFFLVLLLLFLVGFFSLLSGKVKTLHSCQSMV